MLQRTLFGKAEAHGLHTWRVMLPAYISINKYQQAAWIDRNLFGFILHLATGACAFVPEGLWSSQWQPQGMCLLLFLAEVQQ